MKRKWQIIIGLILIAFFVLIAFMTPVLAPNDPNVTNLAMKNTEGEIKREQTQEQG